MPKVKVQSTSQLSAQESYDRLKGLLDNNPDITTYDPSFTCNFNDGKLTGNAEGKLFKAGFNVEHSGAFSTVTIELDLPMKLSLVKGVIQKKLQANLDKALS
ncbi:MAG: hypothetical protein CL677_00900 [Bdellovibrionaceae bacterium]|nr:hypothetical protein [Pseudobdellovibrionaceae bacterium]|tara:strand:- start:448 stop:753 length:306 start_codon:yes stop_codon:yes gene_type:complete